MARQKIEHDRLVSRGARWLTRSHDGTSQAFSMPSFRSPLEFDPCYIGSCGVILTEYVCYLDNIPDAIGFASNFSIVIECKTSRNDFAKDKYKSHRHRDKQPGNFRFYLVPQGLIKPEEAPEGWGLLYDSGKQIKAVKPAPWHDEVEIRAAEYSILYSVTRRFSIRGLMKEIRKPLND